MLIGIFGNLGSGKGLTQTMLSWLYKHRKNAFIACNYKNTIADLILSAEEILLQIPTIGKGYSLKGIFLDELGGILTATDWYSDINTILGTIFRESRKRGCDIIYTSQSPMMVDRNVRRITDIVLLPEYNPKNNKVKIEIHESRGIYWIKDSDLTFDGKLYFDIYDTNEIILPNKIAIKNYYVDKALNDPTLLEELSKVNSKNDRIEQITFYMNIKTKLAKLVLLDIQKLLVVP